jgi:hypothetical protein
MNVIGIRFSLNVWVDHHEAQLSLGRDLVANRPDFLQIVFEFPQ